MKVSIAVHVKFLFLILFICHFCMLGFGNDGNGFAGLWKTFDEKTDEEKSVVNIWVDGGELKGKIVKIFPKPGEDPNPVCDKCKGKLKDKPVLGMNFMWGFSQDGNSWKDGKILDPENGKIYHCRLELTENGKKLKVYGYIKLIFKIGRTQVWIRQQDI